MNRRITTVKPAKTSILTNFEGDIIHDFLLHYYKFKSPNRECRLPATTGFPIYRLLNSVLLPGSQKN
jgi:hypothetical protein